jgi:hypothetical protein
MEILPENVKILTWILPEFHSWGVYNHTLPLLPVLTTNFSASVANCNFVKIADLYILLSEASGWE